MWEKFSVETRFEKITKIKIIKIQIKKKNKFKKK